MNLKQTRLVTENVERLTRFYEHVTGASATVLSSGYVEFQRSPCAGLAIANTATVRAYGAGVAEPAAKKRLHDLEDSGIKGSCGGMIEIDSSHGGMPSWNIRRFRQFHNLR